MSARIIRGDRLRPEVQHEVLRRYVHRMTHENAALRPAVVAHQRCMGYALELVSDQQWLRDHAFHCRKDGNLDHRHNVCMPASFAEA